MATEPILSAPVPNLPLLRKVLDHIDAHPDEWDQRWWNHEHDEVSRDLYELPAACGTTRCIAGWVQFWGEGAVGDDVSKYAQAALGLTAAEAYELFEGDHLWSSAGREGQRVELQRVAEQIAARAGERL